MNEKEFVHSIVDRIQKTIDPKKSRLVVTDRKKLPYAYEVLSYADHGSEDTMRSPIAKETKPTPYETDLLIHEQLKDQTWKPRLVIEAKINSVTTHDAITYSQKAFTHKTVHPYLRYGILLGNRKDYPLPGRLFRHGAHFDFMLSWQTFVPSDDEFQNLIKLILAEVKTSRNLEEIIFNSRSQNRARYTFLHRPLILK